MQVLNNFKIFIFRVFFFYLLKKIKINLKKKNTPKQNIFIDCLWQSPNYYFYLKCFLSALNKKFNIKAFALVNSKSINRFFLKQYNIFDFVLIDYIDNKDSIKLTFYNKIEQLLFNDVMCKQYCLTDIRDKDFINGKIYKKKLQEYFYKKKILKKKIDSKNINFAILSHPISRDHLCLSYALLERKKYFYILNFQNHHMTCRKITSFDQFQKFNFFDVPSLSEIKKLDIAKRSYLIDKGRKYYQKFIQGKVDQISRVKPYGNGKAFFKTKEDFNAYLEILNKNKNVVILGNCWSDYPNAQGVTWFSSYKDWFQTTIQHIKEIKNYNWILKAHPAEAEYTTDTMIDILKKFDLPKNIKIFPEHANCNDIILSIDYVVSARGSGSFEHILSNKITISAAKSKHSHLNLNKFCKSKSEYLNTLSNLNKLKTPTNLQIDDTLIYLASVQSDDIFKRFINDLPFGTHGLKSYKLIFDYLKSPESENKINNEIQCITKWLDTNIKRYNVFKIYSN